MTLTPKEEAVLKLIQEDTTYENYFFKKVSAIRWFFPLKEKGFFTPLKAPPPKPADQEGYFAIPEWNVLPYLERVSQQINITGNEQYIDELLKIIREVSNYRDENGRHIDNYRTWWYFTKILLNLPNDKITDEIIDLLPVWLGTTFSASLPSTEISGKLLPKFLSSNSNVDWKKAERIIEIITGIRWVPTPEKQRNVFKENEEARTIVEPYRLKKAFQKNAKRIGEVCSIGTIHIIAKRVLEIFRRQYLSSSDVEYNGKDYQIRHILCANGIHQIILHSLNYPDDWDGYSRDKIEKNLIKEIPIPEFHDKAEFIAKVKEVFIGERFSTLTTEFDEALSLVYSFQDYSYIWFNSLGASPEHIPDDAKGLLTYILKEILSEKAHFDREGTREVLEKFLNHEYHYPLFKRLAIFIASTEWEKYKEYFFRLVDLEDLRCFEYPDYKAELAILIENNFNKFTMNEKAIIKEIITNGPQILPHENPERYTAYWKLKWLSLLKDDPEFVALYEEQKGITGIDREKFSFGTEVKTITGFGPSPLTTEEILRLSNEELAAKLQEFRSEKTWEGKTVGGFSIALSEAAKTDPIKFIGNLSPFRYTGFIYVYEMLSGIRDAWNEKKDIDWGKLVTFIQDYISPDKFWNDAYIVEKGDFLGGADHEWVSGIVGELIQDGTREDAWAFSEDYFDKAKAIIFLLLRKTEESEEVSDYYTDALNNPCGKLITALVYLALRIVRVNDLKGIKADPRWMPEYRAKFEELLHEKIIEAYTLLGRFLPNLVYLDKEWAKDKISQALSEKGTRHWLAFMEGYLAAGKVQDNLYHLMRPHYEHGLSHEFKNRHNQESLIQHICIGYLRGNETLDTTESLFKKIIDTWNPEQIQEVLSFFWMQRDYLAERSDENEKIRAKIMEFWKLLYEKYKGKDEDTLSREDKRILSSASRLAAILSQLDTKSYEWLMLSAPHVHEEFNAPFFIEYLNDLRDKVDSTETAKFIGGLYLKMLERSTPDFDQAHIQSLVKFLYDAGAKEDASKICNIYGEQGHEFLSDIYDANKNS